MRADKVTSDAQPSKPFQTADGRGQRREVVVAEAEHREVLQREDDAGNGLQLVVREDDLETRHQRPSDARSCCLSVSMHLSDSRTESGTCFNSLSLHSTLSATCCRKGKRVEESMHNHLKSMLSRPRSRRSWGCARRCYSRLGLPAYRAEPLYVQSAWNGRCEQRGKPLVHYPLVMPTVKPSIIPGKHPALKPAASRRRPRSFCTLAWAGETML